MRHFTTVKINPECQIKYNNYPPSQLLHLGNLLRDQIENQPFIIEEELGILILNFSRILNIKPSKKENLKID